MSSLLTIEMFKDLDNEELDKIANLAMTEKGMFTSSHE